MTKKVLIILLLLFSFSFISYSMTLTTITIDGDVEDWTAVLLDPDNYVSDPIKNFGDLDTPTIVQSGRDITNSAVTWDNNYLYFYVEMNTIISNISNILFYLDTDYDNRMKSTDKVVRFMFNNAQLKSYLYNYIPIDGINGDIIPDPGDGQSLVGTVDAGVEKTYLFMKGPLLTRVEMRIPWVDIGMSPGNPLNIHVSTSRGINLPDQVEDNLNLVTTMYAAISITPDNFGSTTAGGSVIYSHLVQNLGNDTDTFNITTSGTLVGWTVGLFSDSGATIPLTDTNGDGIIDTGPLAPGATTTIYVKITSKGNAPTGSTDKTYTNLASTNEPEITDSAFDETVIGDVAIYPARNGFISPGDFIIYEFTIVNNDILAHIFNIETSGTQPSWTVGLYSDSSCTIPLTDSNSDLIPDTGNLLSGLSFTFYLKLDVPGTETIGTIDTTQIDVEAVDDNKITADNFAYTEVQKGIIITPDKTTESGTNSYVFLEHYIQNNFSYSNTVNFTMTGIPPGWAVKLFESDGVTELVDNDSDSNADITNVPPYGEPYYIKSRVYIPTGVPEGIVGEITITADSNSVSDTVLETITVRTLISYASSAYADIKKIFTIGETIYVKASGITSGKVVILWFDNTPTLVYTSPEIQVNASGVAKNDYTPIPGNQIGDWSIIIYESKNGNPTGAPLGTAYVNVGESVLSTDTLKLFPSWSPEDNRVSYISETAAFNDNWHIYYLDLTTLIETKLTDTSDVASLVGINTAPEAVHYSKISWAPDSSPTEGRIIFAAVDKDDGYDNSELYTVNLTQDATGRYPIKKVSPVGMYGNPLEGYGGWVDPNWDGTGFYAPEADGNWVAAAVRGNIFVFKPDSITDGPPSAGGNYKKIIRITNLALSSSVDGLFEPIWFTEGSDLKLAVVYKGITAKSDVYIISNVDDIITETMASPNFGSHLFDYSTEVSAQYQVNNVTNMIKVTETINPIWGITTSPDGLKISFSEDTANVFNNSNFYTSPYAALVNTDFDVYKIDASTTPVPVELFSHPHDEGFGEWSNNGQYLIYIDQPTDDDPSPGNQHTLFLKKFYIVNSIIFGTAGGGFRKHSNSYILRDDAFSSIELPADSIDSPTLISMYEPYGAKHHITFDFEGSIGDFPVIGKEINGLIYTGVARQFDPINLKLNNDAAINIHYTDAELKAAKINKVDENFLVIAFYNTRTKQWKPIKSTVDLNNNIVSAKFHKLGIFGVFIKRAPVDNNLDNIIVYPNPFKVSESSNRKITIDRIPPGQIKEIKIFNIAGELVLEGEYGEFIYFNSDPSTLFPGYEKWTWNLKNKDGKRIASGVYIIVIKTYSGKEVHKKAAIIF